jgi:3-phenylpropionate/trans-cinnamate dioxygenase ferredoxin subunit
MAEFVEVARVAELKDGVMQAVSAAGKEILLAQVGGNYYAADNRCPHMGGKLAQGKLEGTVVTCPRHGSQFDISSGQVVRWLKGAGLGAMLGKALKSPKTLTVYKVKVEGGKIMVEI